MLLLNPSINLGSSTLDDAGPGAWCGRSAGRGSHQHSLLKIAKHGLSFSGHELAVMAGGMLVSFTVSILAIKFLMSYIKRHDFKVFGWYRIVLGLLVIAYFTLIK